MLSPGDLVEGAQVEYYSDSNRCWMPSLVVYVDAETGGIKLNVKPNQVLDLQEQQLRLRPRTKPNKTQLEWVRRTLREGRLEEEAQVVFQRHAKRGSAQDSDLALRLEDIHPAGAELDEKLGISGAVCALKYVAQQAQGKSLSAEGFSEIFWELLWGVQKDFCQALPRDRGSQRRSENPEDIYTFEQTLGKGTFGVVKLARNKATGAERAVKMISKVEHVWGSIEQLEEEIERLCLLDHPHIVRLYEHFEDSRYIYLVMDFCSGGELQAMVAESRAAERRLPELFVADVMRQVLLAIAHVHARGVVHMDLKSQNIMLMPSKRTLPPGRAGEGYTLAHVHEKPHVMVIDLGVAQIFRPGNFKFNRPMGTPMTMAPEVWNGEIHPKADVFSCGVVLFELLSLGYPFRCPADLLEAVRYWAGAPPVPWQAVQHSSEYAKGVCRRMLMQDRRARPTALQCLQAPFLSQSNPGLQSIALTATLAAPRDKLVQLLAAVSQRSVLHRSVALSIARAWPSNQLPSIKRFFHELDTQRAGRLGLDQLEAALERMGLERHRASQAAQAMDLSRDGTVCWTEFVAACIDLGNADYEQTLQQIFDQADADKDGLLSQQDISKLLPAEHLREDNAVRDIFLDISGRTDPGARVDWTSFRKHFQCEKIASAGVTAATSSSSGTDVVAAAPELPPPAEEQHKPEEVERPSVSQQPGFFFVSDFGNAARGMVEWAQNALLPQQQQPVEPGPPTEEEQDMVEDLANMGYTDRKKTLAVLRKHHHLIASDALFRELDECGACPAAR